MNEKMKSMIQIVRIIEWNLFDWILSIRSRIHLYRDSAAEVFRQNRTYFRDRSIKQISTYQKLMLGVAQSTIVTQNSMQWFELEPQHT